MNTYKRKMANLEYFVLGLLYIYFFVVSHFVLDVRLRRASSIFCHLLFLIIVWVYSNIKEEQEINNYNKNKDRYNHANLTGIQMLKLHDLLNQLGRRKQPKYCLYLRQMYHKYEINQIADTNIYEVKGIFEYAFKKEQLVKYVAEYDLEKEKFITLIYGDEKKEKL